MKESIKEVVVHHSSDNSGGCCCGCCLGIAIGYLLWGPPINVKYTPKRAEHSSLNTIVEKDNFLLRSIDHYQREISPLIKERIPRRLCKYEPSCSTYALQAIKQHGQVAGAVMMASRLARCNPMATGGADPVDTPWYAKKVF